MNAFATAGSMLAFEVDRLLNPTRFFDHPRDVLNDATLSIAEKRSILSSWASDSACVESNPLVRKPDGARQPATFDEIMDALKALDASQPKEDDWRRKWPKASSPRASELIQSAYD